MFRPTPKELESCGFAPCTDCREPLGFNKNEFYHSKTIFLSLSKCKHIDYQNGVFYVDGYIESFSNLEQLKNLGATRYFRTENEFENIKKSYPELTWDKEDGCYKTKFLIFRKSAKFGNI